MGEIKKRYAEEKPMVTINFNFGSSGSLQKQIEQGAPADIFMSAATKQMEILSQESLLLEDTKVDLLGNTVVLVVKSDSALAIDFKDSGSNKLQKIALGEPKTVPSGQYAEEIYRTLKILDEVKEKAVYGKSVTEVLTWVESGNVDAGVVYGTDAKASTKVKVVAVATKDLYKTPVVYPVAVIKGSNNVDASKEFLAFLCSKKAKVVFQQYGFDFLIK
jgi:molybdate transport system substrate-binding protein